MLLKWSVYSKIVGRDVKQKMRGHKILQERNLRRLG